MSKQQTDLTESMTDGGIAAKHGLLQDQIVLVGPATANEYNTVKAGIIPIACWRIENFRFAFDSSLVAPEIKKELELLEQLVKDHPPTSKLEGKPGHPLSVFGHTDPTGDDDYNKQLSGRRATAIYALLTHDINLWEKLFSQPFGNDKWGRKSLEAMLDKVSPETMGKTNQEQAIQHERDAGKRRDLFRRYMETLWSPDLKLLKRDFLGHGDDSAGKGDFQGCSEFNPILIFSQKDQARFEQDTDKTARNNANASNRRVVVLIFRKGSRVDPSKWPCPRASEGVAACKKRFWSDGERRRRERLSDKPRTFYEAKDTFACRLYDRLSNNSPCERLGDRRVPVLLDDPFLGLLAKMKVQVRYAAGSGETLGTDDGGIVRVLTDRGRYVDLEFTTSLRNHSLRVFLFPDSVSTDAGVWQRLVDLGHVHDTNPPESPPGADALAIAVSEFQASHGIVPTGDLDEKTRAEIKKSYDAAVPWSEDDLKELKDDKFNDSASAMKDAVA